MHLEFRNLFLVSSSPRLQHVPLHKFHVDDDLRVDLARHSSGQHLVADVAINEPFEKRFCSFLHTTLIEDKWLVQNHERQQHWIKFARMLILHLEHFSD